MADWFSNLSQPAVRVTYGSRPAAGARAFSHVSNEGVFDESPPQAEANIQPPRRTDFRQTVKSIFSSGEKKRKDRDGGIFEDKKFTKVKMDMKDVIRDGCIDDLNYLCQQLEKFEQIPPGERGFSGFMVEIPSNWEASDSRRLEEWLQAIGFLVKVTEMPRKVSYSCCTNKVINYASFNLSLVSFSLFLARNYQEMHKRCAASPGESEITDPSHGPRFFAKLTVRC